jgi:hypothetical protein
MKKIKTVSRNQTLKELLRTRTLRLLNDVLKYLSKYHTIKHPKKNPFIF